MDYCKLIVESVAIGFGSVAVGYEIGLGIKKIRTGFKSAAGEAQGHNKIDETAQPNYWVNHVDRAVLPPQKCSRSNSQQEVVDSSVKAPPSP